MMLACMKICFELTYPVKESSTQAENYDLHREHCLGMPRFTMRNAPLKDYRCLNRLSCCRVTVDGNVKAITKNLAIWESYQPVRPFTAENMKSRWQELDRQPHRRLFDSHCFSLMFTVIRKREIVSQVKL